MYQFMCRPRSALASGLAPSSRVPGCDCEAVPVCSGHNGAATLPTTRRLAATSARLPSVPCRVTLGRSRPPAKPKRRPVPVTPTATPVTRGFVAVLSCKPVFSTFANFASPGHVHQHSASACAAGAGSDLVLKDAVPGCPQRLSAAASRDPRPGERLEPGATDSSTAHTPGRAPPALGTSAPSLSATWRQHAVSPQTWHVVSATLFWCEPLWHARRPSS